MTSSDNRLSNLIVTMVFCAAIFVPLFSGILQTDKAISKVEKRKLAKLPKWPDTLQDIQGYPKSFGAYYADHFGFRESFIRQYNLMKYSIEDSPSSDVTIGKNGWLFLGSIQEGHRKFHDPFGDVMNENLYTKAKLREFAKNISALNSWLNQQGIRYIFVIAPNKHTIYFDQMPDYISKAGEWSATDQLVEFLRLNTNVPVLDLRNALRTAKSEHQLYYKTDSHWNHEGANIAQYEIIKKINKMFPTQISSDHKKMKKGFRTDGDLVKYMGVKNIKDYNPKPIFNRNCKLKHVTRKRSPREPDTWTCSTEKLNTIVFHDSFFNALKPYFIRKFKRSTYIWKKLDYLSLKKIMKQTEPDIVIEEWVERLLPHVYTNEFLTSHDMNRAD